VLTVEYPTNWVIQRVPIAKYLGINILLWSTTLALHAACKSFPAFVAIRTLLGIFEAVCQPTFIILSSMWYKREEQTQIITYWYMMNGMQQIVGGLLAYCFSLLKSGEHPIKSYQAIFITYGSISFLWGLFVLYWLPGKSFFSRNVSAFNMLLQIAPCAQNATRKPTKNS
jgi:MFS family permease